MRSFSFKNPKVWVLLALPFLAWLLPPAPEAASSGIAPDQINLALRRTADGLLRLSGDSTSRIPAIERLGQRAWRVRLDRPFRYEHLPALLQASLDVYNIRRPYEVAVRRCGDTTIDLGYHQEDLSLPDGVPCNRREMPVGCHFIDVTFVDNGPAAPAWLRYSAILLLAMGALAGFWFLRRRQAPPLTAPGEADPQTDWLSFGQSRLDVAGQVLVCGAVRQTLTYRETKLLRLFAANPNRLLERDAILRQVWADEGVLVGRSVDVFVSRLRKKLAADPSVGIVAVNGVGYRLETGRSG